MEQYKEDIFVFVVCGSREHIDTLHFSLKALKKFSKKRIIVLTDSTRNEVVVEHSEIVDIKTPTQYNHHQASIYLKTGLNKFLPTGNLHCYLDTDVVALSAEVDTIFDQYQSPITFCTDHCKVDAFSPSAVNCMCLELFKKDNEKLQFYLKDFEENVLPKLLYIDKCVKEIEVLISASKANRWVYLWHRVKYLLPGYYHLNRKYKMDKKTGIWYDKNKTVLKYSLKDNMLYIAEKTGYTYSNETGEWYRNDGTSLTNLTCNHLIEEINDKFGVAISTPNWCHWNGGVFMFNEDSIAFLDYWHKSTLEIFEDNSWKTRDQGTLATSAWKFNLENHPTLPIKFNFIADYNKESLQYVGNLCFKIDLIKHPIVPYFIHLYHHWGDEDWIVWQDVFKHVNEI